MDARERIDRAYREAEVTLTRVLGEPSDEEAHARLADEILGDLADDYEGAVEISSKALRLAEALYRAVEFETGDGQAIADEIKALHAGLPAEATGLGAVDLLREVADSGALLVDERLRWVEVQIDRETWDAVRAYGTPGGQS